MCFLVMREASGRRAVPNTVVEGGLCLLEVQKVIRCVLLCMLEAVEGALCL